MRFDPAALTAEAQARHQGHGSLDPAITEPLELICDGLESTAELTPIGRDTTHRYLDRLLDGHLALDSIRHADPTVPNGRVSGPVFVVGAPRTGTTAMHRLLAADDRHRVPRGWELLYPTRPAEDSADDRRERAAAELDFPQSMNPALRSIHTYSADMPKECLSAMSFALRSEEFVSRYHLPDYQRWLERCDMTPAYRMHRLVLQVLQTGSPTERWVLKSPVHLQAIPELVATYPDASFVVTHREPADVLASVSSLIATLRSAFSETVDPAAIGRDHLRLYSRSLDRLVDHVDEGRLPVDRTVHVHHHELVDDPLAALTRVYRKLDLPFDDGVRRGAEAATSERREDGVGAHRYTLEEFGLDADRLVAPFARYRERFLEPR